MRRIFDCFTFSTELDLLEFRLDLLAPAVDRFVIVEAPRTFSGLDKPLLFDKNRARFERHLGAITHVVVDDLPLPTPDRWLVERFQRNAILRGLAGVDPDDLVVVSDVDEIPDPAALSALRDKAFDAIALEMRTFLYRANWELSEPLSTLKVKVARAGVLGLPEILRHGSLPCVPEAASHFAYLMSPAEIARKYRWFAHNELDTDHARSPVYLAAMQALAVSAISGQRLTVTSQPHLNSVQRALLDRFPDFFSFESPPISLRRLARLWRKARSDAPIPQRFVSFGDALLESLAQHAVRGQVH